MALCSISLTLDWWVLAFTGPMAHLMAPIAARLALQLLDLHLEGAFELLGLGEFPGSLVY